MIFVDSCVWNAAKNRRDTNHRAACSILSRIDKGEYGVPVVTDYVIDEILTWLHARISHKVAVETGRVFFETTKVQVRKVDWAILKEAYELFKKHDFLSFTDATSVAVMKLSDIGDIATFDEDFSKLGFNVVG